MSTPWWYQGLIGLVGALVVLLGTFLTVRVTRSANKQTNTQASYDQIQEDLSNNRLELRQEQTRNRELSALLQAAQAERDKIAIMFRWAIYYITVLVKWIMDGNGPPPPTAPPQIQKDLDSGPTV